LLAEEYLQRTVLLLPDFTNEEQPQHLACA
jgi:hypothetical protein